MPKRISIWLRQISTGPVTLVALVIFISFTTLVLPAQSAEADEASGGASTPDLSIFYSPDELYQMAEAYGPEGRAAFIHARWTFDVAWPLVYTFFLVTSISWLMSRVFPAESRWQFANLAPVLAASLDFLENASNSLVMARYPLPTPVVAALAPFFTLFKWLVVGVSFFLLLAGLMVAIWKRLK
jgi:hypothetical protein